MSKSLGNVISPYALVEKYGTEATRYLLLRHVHATEDSDVTWEKLDDNNLGGIHDKDDTYTWTTAVTVKIATLNSASFAGFTDWRLPNRAELESLFNLGAVNPSVFSVFNTSCGAFCTAQTCSCTQSTVYWSSSTYQSSPAFAWGAGFYDGNVGPNDKLGNNSVRGVRGGS